MYLLRVYQESFTYIVGKLLLDIQKGTRFNGNSSHCYTDDTYTLAWQRYV